ncbi:hypothetical protein RFI_33863 [Reticulomyxa filosa]|uniref:Uncharacterized protein n=1 Tax=Reticulomyxa filosa TaxID=46433 RepID=X6LPJ6_RETFI|nr:hypothetical protein RFI_33863 [Reticulomyxa filosa]|eukprot:ETO03539.1 hypothetical protein RFI_33863 [Reticulomyxa filosa]
MPPLMTTSAVQIEQDQPPEQRVKEEIKPEPKMSGSSRNQHENNPIHNIDTIKNEESMLQTASLDNPHAFDVEMREVNPTNNAIRTEETNRSYDTNQTMVD